MDNIVLAHPKETALLIIDVQRALFTRNDPIYKAYRLIETINALISRAHLYGVQVIYIQHSNNSILKKGTSGWNFHPDLTPPTNQDLSIHKTHGNAFIETTLQNELQARGIKNLIITGLVTEGCVNATSLGGLELDYNVFLVKQGHSNYSKNAVEVIEKHESDLEGAGAVVVLQEKIDFS